MWPRIVNTTLSVLLDFRDIKEIQRVLVIHRWTTLGEAVVPFFIKKLQAGSLQKNYSKLKPTLQIYF